MSITVPFAKLTGVLVACAAAAVCLLEPVALAQGATTALPSARPSAEDSLAAALFELLAVELDRGFDVTVDVGEAVMSGGTVTALIDVEVVRNTQFLDEVALSLLPFQGVCASTDCMPLRVFGSGGIYGRQGFVDIFLPTAERGRDRSLYWHALFRPLSVVVDLVGHDGRVLRRASQRLRGGDFTFPLGAVPTGAPDGLSTRQSSDLYGPIVASLRMEGIPETVWQAAASISATIIPVVVQNQYLEDDAFSNVAIGMLLPPSDAAELFVEAGVLIVEAFSHVQLVQGPADRDVTWDAATIRRLEGARVVTHVDGVPVASIEQLADVVFEYRDVQVALTVWDQARATSEVIDCRLPALAVDSRTLVPWVYPVYEYLPFGGRPLTPDGSGVFTRAADLGRLMLHGDCLDHR